ncbi:hypothetical protein DIRTYBETTY_200 [Bacillus phage DirtyBetty]|uniref:Uncharacterized protein n=2 Tax=Wphvirus megatron TaxID=1987728 RepID=A0A1B1PAV7_9CAUD|nr:hypothetical protein QLX47_gp198 [Bacillus phage Eyuki]YP_009285142.1 hypothetical protein BIZ88_gp200 [Bacillus phage DirtyBetty]ALA46651.1 hypothetical protein EYUKI_198 [Bacillus phage Eyuki]ANT41285.1 hypothetical protein DIRTYBETTY_200 [Bacillus phage DirtyBetty]ASR79181.1 hypothetical protein ZAINNY_201 [Bacillus phage Zainny]
MTPEQARELINSATDEEIEEVLDETKEDIQRAVRNSFWSEVERLSRKARAMEYELRSRGAL